MVDLTLLKEAINNLVPHDEVNYTVNSWSEYISTVESAKTILNKSDASKDEVNAAVESLKSIDDKLV